MTDYARANSGGATHFGDKDSLSSGDADKVIVGSQFDTEFNAIVTAIASKLETSDFASQAQAEGLTLDTVLITPHTLNDVLVDNAGMAKDIQQLADPLADRLLFWDNSAKAAALLTVSTGLTLSGTTLTSNDSAIVHDNLSGFVADEHVAHSGVTLTAGSGLTGGGTIAASRTFNVGAGTGITVNADDVALDTANTRNVDHSAITFTAGNGLTGGGTLAANRSFAVGAGTGITVGATSISTDDSAIVHDNLSGFVADEHVAHSGVTMTAGTGLTGGGTIAASRTFNLDISGLTNMDISETAPTDSVLVNDGGTMKQLDIQDMGVRVVDASAGDQTFALGDANTVQYVDATTRTFTVPANATVAFPVGAIIYVASIGAGEVTIDPASGVTLNSIVAQSSTANRTVLAGGMAALIKMGADDWNIAGDIS